MDNRDKIISPNDGEDFVITKSQLLHIISDGIIISPHFKKYHINEYKKILERTKYLPNGCKFTERIYQILNNLYEIPKCQICNKGQVQFRSISEGYKRFCCVKCAALGGQVKYRVTINKKTDEDWDKIRDKKSTTLKNKFFEQLINSPRLKNLIIPLFDKNQYMGTKKNGHRLKNKYKFQCIKCGNIFYDNLDDGKIPRCFNCYPIYFWGNTPQKGNYQNIRYDSSWELAFIKYCLVNDIKIERNKKGFVYWYEDKKHKYYPDFYLPEVDLFVEVKNKYLLRLEQTTEKINQFPHKLDIYGDDKIKSILESLEK